tara:strand:+ start:109 stop:342 length:234 start_codon:yes stop_codon:yes gene_type:complete
MKEITPNESVIWASGHYLTEHFPEEWVEWEEEDIYYHISCLIWEPFENYPPEKVWEYIQNLAEDFEQTVNYKINKEL